MNQSDEQQMGISDARANLTEVIAEVRILGRPLVLTRREKPQAVLVSVDWYEKADAYRRIAEAAATVVTELPDAQRTPAMRRLGELVAKSFDD